MLATGFAVGIYMLPILAAPLAPDTAAVQNIATETIYAGRLVHNSLRVGDVKTFNGFIEEVPAGIDVRAYNAVVIWSEAFNQFISAAGYQHSRQDRE